MPLVRFQVRNEYRLGQPELYKEAIREDPKAVLDGVAVAGLVGILRQLGDLADFAAEVFHGLQEQLMTTASKSHKLIVRVQNIEASLPPLEKAVLGQTSHIHFAYTAGCEWHPRIETAQNHFIYNDLPQCIMDSYELCCDPPRLHLLDKFDTGGPGSCLRRYSDPTFFKRVSAYSNEAYSEKTERARKTRKSKKENIEQKKRLSRQNGEFLQGEQMRSSSARMQFISPTVNGRTSSSQTASTIDMTVKSDLEDRSNSFDSIAGAGYIECVFHPSNSVQTDETGHKESSSSRLTQKIDTLQSVSPVMDDNISHDSLEKQIASSSSGVTWDEKEEIVESKSQACDRDKIPEMLTEKQEIDMYEDDLTNIDHSILFDEARNAKPVPSKLQTDEIDSEPENYMDALNVIEPESENDLECETKREVEQLTPLVTHRIMENGVEEANSNVLDHNLSDVVSQTVSGVYLNKELDSDLPNSVQEISPFISEPHLSNVGYVILSDAPVNKEMTGDLADSHVSDFDSPIREQVSNIYRNSVLDCSVDIYAMGGAQTHNDTMSASIETDISFSGPKSSDLPDKEAGRINGNMCKPQETPLYSAGDHSVRFWTNGGILGLEPSKPPDFTMSSSLSKTSNIEIHDDSNHNSMLKSNENIEGKSSSAEVAEHIPKEPSSTCLTSSHNDQPCISGKTSSSSHQGNKFAQSESARDNLDEVNVMTTGSVLSVAPDCKATCIEPNQGSGENSSRVFGLSHRLLINSFRRKVSFDEKARPDNSLKTGILESSGQNCFAHQSLPETTSKDQVGYKYPLDLLPPSPPLEHMKISFHPISGPETSKLKLKFPDGENNHESLQDMFPSFQLVPDSSIPLHDLASNSDDDDTFCRLSPCLSDDCLSTHSDYNSDQWESGESPESSDHGVYDSSQRISSNKSMLSSQEVAGVSNVDRTVDSGHTNTQNEMDPSLCGPLLDFPNFDTLNPVLETECNKNLDYSNVSHAEPTPPLPPLPPVQWRVSKLHLDMMNETQNYISGESEQINDLNVSESTSQQARPAPVDHTQTNYYEGHKPQDGISYKLKDKLEQQKLNRHNVVDKVVMGKEMNETEYFLHQIRTKSFNLRRTVTGTPDATTGPTTNAKVTAILEKANAIRQVVASDDGEDDNWSDTS